ncbi:type II toxin-antitoxin system RelE/ParE family toxin [Serratia fonticola]|jgi:plasmid stabilization system protein ParE|uniref:type II toxin-antitoxin system RelE/ParE family toxin n=1 Tax=Serratia fonticola TaxID=47917 RepID=UPI00141967C3|nr:type II toxin-antitoxin system RelE/ParE family toxin [Serratia fonticola]NXZ85735.1 type II toxin-antitoxin system RelE/ParE family toxin [Serratia fonticola]
MGRRCVARSGTHFEFLYPLNPLAAEQVDDEIELAVESLLENPEMGQALVWGSSQTVEGRLKRLFYVYLSGIYFQDK